jgi:hypothetical protein
VFVWSCIISIYINQTSIVSRYGPSPHAFDIADVFGKWRIH